MKAYIGLLSVLFFLACQTDKRLSPKVSEDLYQYFEIDCTRDTTLRSEEGVLIHIQKNTFNCEKGNQVKLRFVAIDEKYEMVLNHFYTISEDNRMLETAGMFQLADLSNETTDFKNPVRLEIPVDYLNDEMMEFDLVNRNGMISWKTDKKKVVVNGGLSINKGKALFKANCASCHSKSFRDDLTGPALGNVHLYRSKEWLIDFTRNSQAVIAAGDTVAICLYNYWNKSVMTSFPNLSDSEVWSIYEYIANESKRQGIGKDEVEYQTTCDINAIRNASPGLFSTPIQTSFTDRDSTLYNYSLNLNKNYEFKNVDYFWESQAFIESVVVKMDKAYDDLFIAMVLKNRNVVIPFKKRGKGNMTYELLNSKGKDRINFPIAEKVDIIAFAGNPVAQVMIQSYTTRTTGNEIDLKLVSIEDFDFIAALKDL